jgi:hypothetical protein
MCGAITSTPQYAFMVWCSVKKRTGTTLPLPLLSADLLSLPSYLFVSGLELLSSADIFSLSVSWFGCV